MVCGRCGTENEAGRKFCKECGTVLAVACANCGAANAPDAKFCGECGTALGAAVAPAHSESSPEPKTERRLVSVLFVDMVGFTSLSEHRDAEDVRELLGRYFDTAREIVERHAGLVEKFIGDAVMAVWGTPTAHEDDAERAVRAAIEIVAAVRALGRELGIDLDARGGVLTGEAAATVGAVSQGIVTGDLVNTASRLQSAAEPGSVLVGEATVRSASRAIAFTEVGPIALKGKDEPVRAWTADRVIAQRRGEGRAAALEPPFVGRDEDLHLVKQLLHATERDGKARLLSIVGPAGIGKSRLAWEFQKYIDGLAKDIYWHQGRCPAYGDGVTFWALGEMVRMRAGVAEGDDPADARRAVAEALTTNVPDEDERRWIEPCLLHLLGLADRPAGEPEELFSAWRTFFERIAERGPTVLVFEDLQWADSGLLDFVDSILEWSRDHPILVVSVARPELADRRPDWGTGQRNVTTLHPDPLRDDEMAELVTGFVEGIAPADVDRIVSQAEGVPLYAIETVRMLADRGVVEAGESSYRLVGDIGELAVPETLQALIAARLDALEPDARALVQDASVLGKSFPAAALAAVTGRSRDDVEASLKELIRRDVIEQELDRRSPERGQYGFIQSLIREVAYGTLAKPDRRAKHLATAHYFESLEDDELAGVVATHYAEAYRATPPGPEAESLGARARDWLTAAADRASSLGSPEQAVAFADQALEITADGPERAALLRRAGKALFYMNRLDESQARLDEAEDLYRRLGDLSSVGEVIAGASRGIMIAGRIPEAIAKLEAGLAELRDDPEYDLGRGWLLVTLGERHRDAGRYGISLGYVEQALVIAERLDERRLLSRAINERGSALWGLGRKFEATLLLRGFVEIARDEGQLDEIAVGATSLAIAAGFDDPRASMDGLREAIKATRRAGLRGLEVINQANLAEAAYDVGRWDLAAEALDALEGREVSGFIEQSVQVCYAMLEGSRGDLDAARERLDRAQAYLDSTESQADMRDWADRAFATVALMSGDPETAYRRAVGPVDTSPNAINSPRCAWIASIAALWLRDRDRAAHVLELERGMTGGWVDTVRQVGEGGIAALDGDVEGGATLLRSAIDRLADAELPLDHAYATSVAVAVLPPSEVPEEALERARETLRALGALTMLERLEAGMSPASAVDS